MFDDVSLVVVIELVGEELVMMLVGTVVELTEVVGLLVLVDVAVVGVVLVVEVEELDDDRMEVVEAVVEDVSGDEDQEKVAVLKIIGPYAPQVAFTV